VRIVVLTTSYPRFRGDAAGRFVGDAVGFLREHGHDVRVVSPRDFGHFGIAYGSGVVGNLRAAPWKLVFLPLLLLRFVHAARRAARGADVVHAHWLPLAVVGLATRKPVVVQLWGTDVELARRARPLARALLRRCAAVVCASSALAESARGLGARDVRVIPSGVRIPERNGREEEPPFVLYAGRLSPEKGVLELVEAAEGMRLVVAGDGPLRDQVPGALGFLPRHELEPYYASCAVVACPSFREGYGVACAEAMAHGKPVVASEVGGLRELVEDGETGLLVTPGDVEALRAALERLLADPELRRRLGRSARRRAVERLSWETVTDRIVQVYENAVRAT
jgi:glycosyltransferase involved in cell wall biosynthesis